MKKQKVKKILSKEQEENILNILSNNFSNGDHFDFSFNFKNYNYSEEFIEKAIPYLDSKTLGSIITNDNCKYIFLLSENSIKKILKYKYVCLQFSYYANRIFKKRLFSEDFLQSYINKFTRKNSYYFSNNISLISIYQNMSEDFIIKNIKILNVEFLIRNKNITKDVKNKIISLREII
jgi:hypothetical protein